MRLVVDMNLSVDWISPLQEAGLDAVHWTSVGPADASDEAIMQWARANDAVVLTRDLDFAANLAITGHIFPSVVQLRIEQARPDRHLSLVHRALSMHQRHLEQGAIVTVQANRIRVRVLDSDTKL